MGYLNQSVIGPGDYVFLTLSCINAKVPAVLTLSCIDVKVSAVLTLSCIEAKV